MYGKLNRNQLEDESGDVRNDTSSMIPAESTALSVTLNANIRLRSSLNTQNRDSTFI